MEKREEILKIIEGIDFHYYGGLNFDYDRVESYDHNERCADDFCRCTTLENFKIYDIDATLFANRIKEFMNVDGDDSLFTNDLIKICEKLTTDDFYFNVSGGYYGEELDGVTLDNKDVINQIANIFSIKTYRREKLKKIISSIEIEEDYIKKILTDEYGYILDSLLDSKFKIVEIDTKDIVFPQKEYNEFIKSQNLSTYKNVEDVCGLVKNINGKYHVIDGYHRINANINKPKLKVILAYK